MALDASEYAVDSTNPLDVVVTYPISGTIDFGWGATVDMSVTARDLALNDVDSDPSSPAPDPVNWSFSTEADNDPPAISNLIPTPPADHSPLVGVPVDTPIAFRLTDSKAGLNLDTLELWMTVGTGAATLIPNDQLTIVSTPTGSDSPSYADVTYKPGAPLPYGAGVEIKVDVRDRAPGANRILNDEGTGSPFDWYFTTGQLPKYRIVGKVVDQDGAGVAGATVTIEDTTGAQAPRTSVTDGNGSYVSYDLVAGNYRISTALAEYDFVPSERLVSLVDADVKDQDFTGTLNPESLEILRGCRMEPSLADAEPGARYQFERLGYFCVDLDSTPAKPVFNRTVTLKDSWVKSSK